MDALAWPSIRCTALALAPADTASEAAVWRRSWGVMAGKVSSASRQAATAGAKTRLRQLLLRSTLPWVRIHKLHIDPSRVPPGDMFDIFDVDIDTIIHVELRRKLASEIVENDPARNTAAKQRQLTELRHVTADLRQIADGVVAAGLPLGGKPGRAIDEAYENLRIAVNEAHPKAGDPSPALLDEIIDRNLTPTVPTDYTHWKPNHSIIEAPDVVIDHGGFDAIIGNPPRSSAGRRSPARWGPTFATGSSMWLPVGCEGVLTRWPTSSCAPPRCCRRTAAWV